MRSFLNRVGESVYFALEQVGDFVFFVWKVLKNAFKSPFYIGEVVKQAEYLGVKSLPVISMTGLFSGMIISLEVGKSLEAMVKGTVQYIGGVTSFSIVKEIGPILTALIVVSRVGSAMTAELGTMKITEQIDALETMAVHPLKFLVVPRVLAGTFMLPLLTIFSAFIGVVGGWFIAHAVLHVSDSTYWYLAVKALKVGDVIDSLIKSTSFGVIISMVSTYYGFNTTGGAEGVGKSTTKSVVMSSFLILVADYIISSILIAIKGV